MLRRTFALFTVFALVAVGALLFVMAYNGLMGAWLQSYVLQLRRCPYLSEQLCVRHPGCQSYYEASTSTPNRPEFKECRPVTAQTSAAEPLCGRTGGQWSRTKFGDYCQCPVGRTYRVDKGCQ